MIRAVLFDMDGVVSDTQSLHANVESELLSRFGVDIPPEEVTKRYAGVRTREFFRELLDAQHATYNLDALLDEKWRRMEELASQAVVAIDGAVDLIAGLASQHFTLALVSASNRRYVQSVLRKLEITQYFTCVVCGDEIEHGKPNPEGFLKAAATLGLAPEECLVIEDGVSGMEAAKRGNMSCIGLVADKTASYPTQNLVTHLSEITPEYIASLK